MSANVQSMFYTGEKPWHKLGKELPNAATSAEAIEAAGLNWTVSKHPLITTIKGEFIKVPNKFAIVRDDNHTVLGTVGPVYTPLQNKPAFSFFDAVVGEKAAMYHTAGALGEGERVWILAKLPGYIQTTKDDVTEKFLLLTNSHDGTGAVQILFTPIRVVCQNTLNIAVASAESKTKLRHTMTLGSRVEDVRRQLGILNNRFTMFEELSKRMASTPLTYSGFKEFIKGTGVLPKGSFEPIGNGSAFEVSTRAENIMDEVSRLFEHGKGNDLPGVKGTVWAGFNAVTEYVDYFRSTRGDEGENRAKSLLFGSGANLKQSAWDKAVSLVK